MIAISVLIGISMTRVWGDSWLRLRVEENRPAVDHSRGRLCHEKGGIRISSTVTVLVCSVKSAVRYGAAWKPNKRQGRRFLNTRKLKHCWSRPRSARRRCGAVKDG